MEIIWFVTWKLVLVSLAVVYLGLLIFLSGVTIALWYENDKKIVGPLLSFWFFVLFMISLSAGGNFFASQNGEDYINKLKQTYREYIKQLEEEDKKSDANVKIYLPTKVERFFLAEFDPPKHVYVTLKHEKTGQLFERLYVSKHCSTRPEVHQLYNVVVTPYHTKADPTIRWEFNNLSREFCS